MPEFIPAFLKGYSDSSFTNPHEVVLPDTPPDRKGDFTHMGAKYWGFETSRHIATSINADNQQFNYNADAYHWFKIGLKQRSKIEQIKIGTQWFTGNQVPRVSVELIDGTSRHLVIDNATLPPDAEQVFEVEPTYATDCLIKCYHEGGIARVNLFGEPGEPLYQQQNILTHATVSHTSNDHYGKPEDAVKGNREQDYMIGWESARSGFGEHALFTLASPETVGSIVVDTYLHRLNPPLSCHVFAANLDQIQLADAVKVLPRWKIIYDGGEETIPDNFQQFMLERQFEDEHQFTIKLHHNVDSPWQALLPFAPLQPDSWHEFNTLAPIGKVNNIYYMYYPNGGIHGLKMYSKIN